MGCWSRARKSKKRARSLTNTVSSREDRVHGVLRARDARGAGRVRSGGGTLLCRPMRRIATSVGSKARDNLRSPRRELSKLNKAEKFLLQ